MRLLVLTAMLLAASPLRAQQVFLGSDQNTGIVVPNATNAPNATSARTAFAASVFARGGTLANLITFETVPLTSLPGIIDIAPGVTASGLNQVAASGAGVSEDTPLAAFIGFNTTAGGTRSLRSASSASFSISRLTISFATPIDFFGGFITGVESNFVFARGPVTQRLATTGFDGGITWFGVVSDTPFTSISFTASDNVFADAFSIDDIVYGRTSVVPEPSTYALLAAGLVGLAVARRRRML